MEYKDHFSSQLIQLAKNWQFWKPIVISKHSRGTYSSGTFHDFFPPFDVSAKGLLQLIAAHDPSLL